MQTAITPAIDVAQKQHAIESILATPDAFREWLKGKSEDSMVGSRGSGFACPLAYFIREYQGVLFSWVVNEFVAVGLSHIHWNWDVAYSWGVNHTATSPLPLWARTFVASVDSLQGERVFGERISARECLAVLQPKGE